MISFDLDWQLVEEPNLEQGKLVKVQRDDVLERVFDIAPTYEEVVVRTYEATGGKDVEYVPIDPGVFHWEGIDTNGVRIALYDLPEFFMLYLPFTEQELFVRNTEETQEMQDAAICELYEQNLELQAELDDAVTSLYEMLIGG